LHDLETPACERAQEGSRFLPRVDAPGKRRRWNLSEEPMAPIPPRLIGRYGSRPGPKMVVVAGVHGNEPAGLESGRIVLARLAELRPKFSGELVVLAGNRRALAQGQRYLSKDLNRQFTAERVEAIRRSRPEDRTDPEDQEMYELIQVLETELGSS